VSTENPVLRSFTGLGPFEDLVDRIRLEVTDSSLVPVLHEPNATYRFPIDEVAHLGLRLVFDWTPEELAEAARSARVPLDRARLHVIVEDTFLKERESLVPEGIRVSEVPERLVLATRAGRRPAALRNRNTGYEVHAVWVLAEQMEEVLAFRPHRKGTVLAAASFPIRSERNDQGLDPLPLDAEARERTGLPTSTVLYVECDGSLLDEEDLARAVTIYVNEHLYEAMMGRGPQKTAVVQQLALEAWSQIVHAVREELTDEFEWDGTSGAALRLLFRLVRGERPKVSPLQFVTLVRDDPRFVCALLSGVAGQARLLLKVVGDEETKEDER
jgi:hypothetical protein